MFGQALYLLFRYIWITLMKLGLNEFKAERSYQFVWHRKNVKGHHELSSLESKTSSMELFSSRRWRLDRAKQKAVVFMLNRKN